jgi:GT2 family glycosyltransferase/glycosyltransferase involved in cell wall biosynthesis
VKPRWVQLQSVPILRELCTLLQRYFTRLLDCLWRVDSRLLFDESYYLAHNEDVASCGMDPLFHFLRYGGAEGRKPHPLFDSSYYLARYPDVARSGMNPLLHFLRFGGLEGRQPHADFDTGFYQATNPDVTAHKINPLVHFLKHGAAEKRSPHPDFDPAFYLSANPGVAAAKLDPLVHFVTRGATEGCLLRPSYPKNPPASSFLPSKDESGPFPFREVDVVVPIYGGVEETRACLDSVLSSKSVAQFRLIAVNDHSPEPEISAYLRQLCNAQKIILIENPQNLGFVESANIGMKAGANDVVLLNSDTLVFDDWLDRLAACAYSDDRTATVTPFSNKATICSYPVMCADNEMPKDGLQEIDATFRSVNHGRSVEIPTAVGFCMYIRRACLQETGFFDVQSFGLGYGEENDFCMRAAQNGWKHKLACDVFVYHVGSVSFGSAVSQRQSGMRVLIEKYPAYPDLVQQHVGADPAYPYRIAVTAQRIRSSPDRVLLSVVHPLGGGVAQHVRELVALTEDRVIWLTLRPSPPDHVTLECFREQYRFSLTVHARLEYDVLLTVLGACGVERVHIHHLMAHTADIYRLIRELKVPFDFTVHDYYTICPQVTLSDEHGKYCGEPKREGCDRCIERRPAGGELVDISSWRAKYGWALTKANRVIAPSADAAARITRYYPEVHVITAEHPSSQSCKTIVPRGLAERDPLRVAVLGTMAIHKGLELLCDSSMAARRSGLPLEFILVGSRETALLHGEVAFREMGSYQQSELPGILESIRPHLVWFPCSWPETFSYTLSTCLELGLPVAAHRIGAFPERLGGRPWSWIVPLDWYAEAWLDFFMRVRLENFLPGRSPAYPPNLPRVAADFYESEYLGAGSRASTEFPAVPRPTSKPITIAAVVASDHAGQIQACGYVRIVQPLTHPTVTDDVRLNLVAPQELLASEADIVLIQRVTVRDIGLAQEIVCQCRRRGSRLIFEIDDDLFHLPREHPEYEQYQHITAAAQLLANAADTVVVSSHWLRKQMLPFNENVVVLPNYLDDRLWEAPAEGKASFTEPIRMVYAATVSHRPDLKFFRQAVAGLSPGLRRKVQIDVIGITESCNEAGFFHSRPVPAEIAASYPRFVKWIQAQKRWHWGVAPLLDTPFNRSKSALKFLEYSALGIPSICSDISPYRDAVRHRETGLLAANDLDSWRSALECAICDTALWTRLRNQCHSVYSENTVSANAPAIRSIWRFLAATTPSASTQPASQ